MFKIASRIDLGIRGHASTTAARPSSGSRASFCAPRLPRSARFPVESEASSSPSSPTCHWEAPALLGALGKQSRRRTGVLRGNVGTLANYKKKPSMKYSTTLLFVGRKSETHGAPVCLAMTAVKEKLGKASAILFFKMARRENGTGSEHKQRKSFQTNVASRCLSHFPAGAPPASLNL
ncbi:MAG: hypothetical protein HYX69_06965 [Planctomycetia bacterium]|nr:hypothetical protein [Planctomycetia bacterium]